MAWKFYEKGFIGCILKEERKGKRKGRREGQADPYSFALTMVFILIFILIFQVLLNNKIKVKLKTGKTSVGFVVTISARISGICMWAKEKKRPYPCLFWLAKQCKEIDMLLMWYFHIFVTVHFKKFFWKSMSCLISFTANYFLQPPKYKEAGSLWHMNPKKKTKKRMQRKTQASFFW